MSVPFVFVDGKVFLDQTETDKQRLVFYTALGVLINRTNPEEIIIAWDTEYGFSYYNLNSGKYIIIGSSSPESYKFPDSLTNALLYPPKISEKVESFLIELLNECKYF